MSAETIDLFYSPGQPRAADGTWSKSGGSGGAPSAAQQSIDRERELIARMDKAAADRKAKNAAYRAKHGPVTTIEDGRLPDILNNGDLESQREAYGLFREGLTGVIAKSTGLEVRETGSSDLVAVAIMNPNGEGPAGYIHRDIYGEDGRVTVNHKRFELSMESRGQGLGAKLDKDAEDYYRKIGVDQIELTANIDVGGYAWARLGYDFQDPRDSGVALAYAPKPSTGSAKYAADRAAADAKYAKFKKSDVPADAPSSFEISQMGREPGMTTWPGKELMLTQEWQGVKYLTPAPVEQFAALVSRETLFKFNPAQPRGANGRWTDGARRAAGQPQRTVKARSLLAEGKYNAAVKASFGTNVRTVSLENYQGIDQFDSKQLKAVREQSIRTVAESLIDLNNAYPGVAIEEIAIMPMGMMPLPVRGALGAVNAIPKRGGGPGPVTVRSLMISSAAFLSPEDGGVGGSEEGWSFAKDIRGVVTHEYGHALQYSMLSDSEMVQRPDRTWTDIQPKATSWVKEWESANGPVTKHDTSKYGTSSTPELVAESFADFHQNGNNALPLSKYIARQLLAGAREASAPPNTAMSEAETIDMFYSPSQPRGGDGRWKSAGGASTAGLQSKFNKAVPGLDSLSFERSEEDSTIRVTATRGTAEAALTMDMHRQVMVDRVAPSGGSVDLALEMDKGFRAAGVYGGIRNPEILRQARRALQDGWTEGPMPIQAAQTHDLKPMSESSTIKHFEASVPVPKGTTDSVEAYVEDGMAGQAPLLNRFLRGGGTGNEIYSQRVESIRAGISAQTPAPEPFVVYRGVNNLPDIDITGTTLTDAGFTSTTLRPEVASRWVGKTGGIMEIVVPKGTRALSVNKVEDSTMSVTTSEAEILMAPGVRFRVLHDTVARPGAPRTIKILMEGIE